MNIFFKVILPGLTILLNGCAGSASIIPASNSDESTAYRNNCGSCHALPHPKRLSYTAWKNLIPVMQIRMKERRMPDLDVETKKQIMSYLEKYSQY